MMRVVRECTKQYGMGTNPRGGVYREVIGLTPHQREVVEAAGIPPKWWGIGGSATRLYHVPARMVSRGGDRGNVPLDGGVHPAWQALFAE